MADNGSEQAILARFMQMVPSRLLVCRKKNTTGPISFYLYETNDESNETIISTSVLLFQYIFDDECLFTDRKKDLVKLQLGEYVSLGKVESELKTCPVVENICVYGDANKAYTVALVVPNQHYLEEIADNLGITGKSLEELCSNPQIEKAVLQELVEQAKKCTFLYIFDFCSFDRFYYFCYRQYY